MHRLLGDAGRVGALADEHFYRCTHNIAEGAGAAPLAALLKDKERKGARFAVILSGGNIDRELYCDALREGPQ